MQRRCAYLTRWLITPTWSSLCIQFLLVHALAAEKLSPVYPALLSTENPSRLYTFAIRYDDAATGGERRVLSLRMIGPLDDGRMWAALRWVASSMLSISREWRGVMWNSWLECPEHPKDRTYLVTPDMVRGVIVSIMSPPPWIR